MAVLALISVLVKPTKWLFEYHRFGPISLRYGSSTSRRNCYHRRFIKVLACNSVVRKQARGTNGRSHVRPPDTDTPRLKSNVSSAYRDPNNKSCDNYLSTWRWGTILLANFCEIYVGRDDIQNEFLRTLWLNRLHSAIQAILMTQAYLSLKMQAVIADTLYRSRCLCISALASDHVQTLRSKRLTYRP